MFVVYHKNTTRYLKNHPGVKTDRHLFGSMGAARAAITRAVKDTALKVQPIVATDFLIADSEVYHSQIEKLVTKINLQSKRPFHQRINTPMICDPSTEAYWSA